MIKLEENELSSLSYATLNVPNQMQPLQEFDSRIN